MKLLNPMKNKIIKETIYVAIIEQSDYNTVYTNGLINHKNNKHIIEFYNINELKNWLLKIEKQTNKPVYKILKTSHVEIELTIKIKD